jgi:hypothetical protein
MSLPGSCCETAILRHPSFGTPSIAACTPGGMRPGAEARSDFRPSYARVLRTVCKRQGRRSMDEGRCQWRSTLIGVGVALVALAAVVAALGPALALIVR